MKRLLVFLLAITISYCQITCNNSIPYSNISVTSYGGGNLSISSFFYSPNVATVTWYNPYYYQNASLIISGWYSMNGTLIQANVISSNNQVNASLSYTQNGVLSSTIYTSMYQTNYLFSTIDYKNYNISISVMATYNYTFSFNISLMTNGYNQKNYTCMPTCGNGTLAFATSINGSQSQDQYTCVQNGTSSLPCEDQGLIPTNLYITYTNIQINNFGNTIIGKFTPNYFNNTGYLYFMPSRGQSYSLLEAFLVFSDPTLPNAVNVSATNSGYTKLLSKQINNFSYVFAQPNTASGVGASFNLTFNASYYTNLSVQFTISLFQGGYNNLKNYTCDSVCTKNISFARINTQLVPTQFICDEAPDFPCSGLQQPINISYASTNNQNITLQRYGNSLYATWKYPVYGQSAIISFFGWYTDNGTAVFTLAQAVNATFPPANLTIGLNQRKVIQSRVDNTSWVFAQKDSSNSNFFIQVTASTYNDFQLEFLLYYAGYNNFYNGTCQSTCSGNIGFATADNYTVPDEFVCLQTGDINETTYDYWFQ